LLRFDLQLGIAVTATALRRALVDFFMSGEFSDEQRAGALRTAHRPRRGAGTAPPAARARPAPLAQGKLSRFPAGVIAEGCGNSLATWRAAYDKRGSLRRAKQCAAAFAELPLAREGDDPAGAAAAEEDWDSGASSDGEEGGDAGDAPDAAAACATTPAPATQQAVGAGAVAELNGSMPVIHADLPAGAGGGAGGAASTGALALALVPAPAGGQLGLQDLQDLFDRPAPRRGRPPRPRLAAPVAPAGPRFSYALRPGARFLTAYAVGRIQTGGARNLLAAVTRTLEGAEPGWTPERAWGAGGDRPNTTAMKYALAGGKAAYDRCAAPGCEECMADRARYEPNV